MDGWMIILNAVTNFEGYRVRTITSGTKILDKRLMQTFMALQLGLKIGSYKIVVLKKGQGWFTENFSIKTSSQKALEDMLEQREKNLSDICQK